MKLFDFVGYQTIYFYQTQLRFYELGFKEMKREFEGSWNKTILNLIYFSFMVSIKLIGCNKLLSTDLLIYGNDFIVYKLL